MNKRTSLLIQAALIMVILLAVIGATLATPAGALPAPTATPQPPTTHHFLLNQQDEAYVLCADGQFVIEVNGVDSIRLRCVGD